MKIFKLSVICLFLSLTSCSTCKKLYEAKEYDEIISKLSGRSELNETQIEILAQSYHQANQNDFSKIMELKKTGQPDIWLEIFYRTSNINDRQGMVDKMPKDIKSKINYKKLSLKEELTNSKMKAETFLSAKANHLLRARTAESLKEAEKLINQLQRLNPRNENIDDLRLKLVLSSAQHIIFRIATPTDLCMPEDFAQLALDFDDNTIYGTPFDIVYNDKASYDLMILILINEKNISPERIDAVTFEEKNGSKTAKVTDKTMSKTASITGEIELIDVKNKNILIKTPFDISSTFRHNYAVFEGDKEACSEQTLSLSNNKSIDFPSDTSLLRDIATKLNDVIKTHYQKK